MMASVLANLGIVAEYEGDLDGALAFHEQALELRAEIGDRWALAAAKTNLGEMLMMQRALRGGARPARGGAAA